MTRDVRRLLPYCDEGVVRSNTGTVRGGSPLFSFCPPTPISHASRKISHAEHGTQSEKRLIFSVWPDSPERDDPRIDL